MTQGDNINNFYKFIHKINIALPNECWNWQGRLNKTGQPRDGHDINVIRIIYFLIFSNSGKFKIKHKCHNSLCCNPGHLYIESLENEEYLIIKARLKKEHRRRSYMKDVENKKAIEQRKKYLSIPKNKEKVACTRRKYKKEKFNNNVNFKLSEYLRNRINKAIKRGQKAGSAISDLGCSIDFFKSYIEQQFQSEMSWENYGEWHLDHIIPLASFDLADRDQFLKACHYTNYQPLWAIDNLSKGDKLDWYK